MSFATKSDALVGRLLSGRYEIIEKIGTGGMGVVYRARHVLLDRDVAIKILRMQFGDDEYERMRRFKQEGRVISSLRHANIVAAYDLGIDDNDVFLVMEYLKGNSLADEIDAKGKLSWSRAMPIFIQIGNALAYAHSKGIIHRDIKPSNVMLTKDENGREHVKLLDFGVAKILNDSKASIAPVTKTGVVFGSPPYMSPEQCTGHAPDARSDIYSFGCVMYEALTARTPITGDNSLEILHNQVVSVPPDFSQLSVKLPKGLKEIIWKCLEKEIELRYQSMDEVNADLEAFAADPEFVPVAAEVALQDPPSVKRAYRLAAMCTAVIFALLFVVSPRSPLHVQHHHHDLTLRDDDTRLAAIKLKQAINKDKSLLPASDPALKDMERIEALLNKKK